MAVLETVVPIFLIIMFGCLIRRLGWLKSSFVEESNRFIFLFSLPFLIFTGIVRSRIKDVYLSYILSVIVPSMAILCISLFAGLALRLRGGRLGTFVQTAFHGNVSYIGLAVLFYLLGEEGIKRGSVLIGFLILFNNVMAVVILSWAGGEGKGGSPLKALLSILKSPVVIATFAGMAVLYLNIPMPRILLRSMGILANIALPLALIIIGASISMGTVRKSFKLSSLVVLMKLLLLPYLAVLYFKVVPASAGDVLPAVILLATPTATTSYILAHQVGGDPELASSVVTLATLLSPLTYIIWLSFLQ
jgi:malate permease and related proteins